MNDNLAGLVAHVSIFGLYSARALYRLTGEWIVFAKVNNRNIYLTLASHEEGDWNILQRCMPAIEEFPELRQTEPFKSAVKSAQTRSGWDGCP